MQTNRGFTYHKWTDLNGVDYTIQDCSIATEACIWLGAQQRMHLTLDIVFDILDAYREGVAITGRDRYNAQYQFSFATVQHRKVQFGVTTYYWHDELKEADATDMLHVTESQFLDIIQHLQYWLWNTYLSTGDRLSLPAKNNASLYPTKDHAVRQWAADITARSASIFQVYPCRHSGIKRGPVQFRIKGSNPLAIVELAKLKVDILNDLSQPACVTPSTAFRNAAHVKSKSQTASGTFDEYRRQRDEIAKEQAHYLNNEQRIWDRDKFLCDESRTNVFPDHFFDDDEDD